MTLDLLQQLHRACGRIGIKLEHYPQVERMLKNSDANAVREFIRMIDYVEHNERTKPRFQFL